VRIPRAFRNQLDVKVRICWRANRDGFRYPAGNAPRTAVLGSWFREAGNVRSFRGWTAEAESYAPEVIVATLAQLQDLAAARAASPTRAVIAIAKPGAPLLSSADREELWRAFHVPVFEQIVGARGKVLAAECEAHDGLHVESAEVSAPGYALDDRTCACGLKSPRLAPVEQIERMRSVAAYAR